MTAVDETPADENVIETNHFIPRLCHIRKRSDYPGYGFSLFFNEQDGRQHVCRINVNSPAEEAGLLEGDILIEVNDANVEDEDHASVLQRIIDSGNEVYLLVVGTETENFYKRQGTNSYGPYGQQQMNHYHAGYDQGPTKAPQQPNPYHAGNNLPNYGQSFGGPAGRNPMTQQPRTPIVIQPMDVESDIPCDLTIPAIVICFCFCWCTGAIAVCNAFKANEHFHQGNIQQGKRYREYAIAAMFITVIIGIAIGAGILYSVRQKYYELY